MENIKEFEKEITARSTTDAMRYAMSNTGLTGPELLDRNMAVCKMIEDKVYQGVDFIDGFDKMDHDKQAYELAVYRHKMVEDISEMQQIITMYGGETLADAINAVKKGKRYVTEYEELPADTIEGPSQEVIDDLRYNQPKEIDQELLDKAKQDWEASQQKSSFMPNKIDIDAEIKGEE